MSIGAIALIGVYLVGFFLLLSYHGSNFGTKESFWILCTYGNQFDLDCWLQAKERHLSFKHKKTQEALLLVWTDKACHGWQ
jgi:hypothetical protein